jgi:hypothetical protein
MRLPAILARFLGASPAEEAVKAFDVEAASQREQMARAVAEEAVKALDTARADLDTATDAFDASGHVEAAARVSTAQLQLARAERLEVAARAAAGAALVELQHIRLAGAFLDARQEEQEASDAAQEATAAFASGIEAVLELVALVEDTGARLDDARARKATARASTDTARSALAAIDPQLAATAPRSADPASVTFPATRTRVEAMATAAVQLAALAGRCAEEARAIVRDQRVAADDLGAPAMPVLAGDVVLERVGWRGLAAPPDPTLAPTRHVNMLVLGRDDMSPNTAGAWAHGDAAATAATVDELLGEPIEMVQARRFPKPAPHGVSPRGIKV